MAELDLQKLLAEATEQRSSITTALLAIQKSLDKMQPAVTKMEPVPTSLEPAVNELPAWGSGVDTAVGKPQTDIGDILGHLTKIATRSFPTSSSSTRAPSRCSTECLVRDDDWLQPMSAKSNESNVTHVVGVDNNVVDSIASLPSRGLTSSSPAITVVIPTASDVEDVPEDALPATTVCSATAHNTCSTSGLGPTASTIQATVVPLYMAVVLPFDPQFPKSVSSVMCNLPAAMTKMDSTALLKLLPTLEYPCDTSPSSVVTVRILSSDFTCYEFLTLPWDPGQQAIYLSALIHAQAYDANKAEFLPAVQVLGWDLISGIQHEKPWDPGTSLLTATSRITYMMGSMQDNFQLSLLFYLQCVQQTNAVFEAPPCWERHRIRIFWSGVAPDFLMTDLLQEDLNEKPKYNVPVTSGESRYELLHTSFLWRTNALCIFLDCSARFQWKVAWLFYHLHDYYLVALHGPSMTIKYFTQVWIYTVYKQGLIIRSSTNLYCGNTTKSEGMHEFMTIIIQLTYICQLVCLYGKILEKSEASAEEFSINKASIQLHKKKKECMAMEIYMGVISGDFQERMLLIKSIWVWSLYLARSAMKIKQDVTCNMVCRELRQFGLFVLHLKNGVSYCSCHYTAGGDTWYGCELDLVNLHDSKVMLVELSSWNRELVTRVVQARPSWESYSLENLSTLLHSATSDSENTQVQASMMLMDTSGQWHFLRKDEFEGSGNSSRDGLMVPQSANGIQGSKLRGSNQVCAFHQWSAHCLISGAKWHWQKEIANPCYMVREHWQLHTDLGSAHKRRVQPNAAGSKGFKSKIWLGFGIPLVKSNLTGNKPLLVSTNPAKDLRLLQLEHPIPILAMSSHQLPCDMKSAIQYVKIVKISLKLIQVGVVPLLGSNSRSGRHLEQLWDPGGNTSSVCLYQAPFQVERCIMVPAFVAHHYYITTILDKVHFVHAYYEVPVGTGHNILKDYFDFDQVCVNKDYYLDTPESPTSFTSTSTIVTFVKATTTNLAALGTLAEIFRRRLGVKPSFKEWGMSREQLQYYIMHFR